MRHRQGSCLTAEVRTRRIPACPSRRARPQL